MLKTLLKGCKQHQINRKKQTSDTAAFNCDITVDMAVTVYSTHIDYEEER